jgi:pimeloyl-ACP methyl ester carboxylesterase
VKRQHRKRFGVSDSDVQFDIVAHSMGGLIARYYLRYGDAGLPSDGSLPELTWAGAENVDGLILVGTPNAGASTSLRRLVEGKDFPLWLPDYPPALLGTFPSIYQLLPRTRHAMVKQAAKGHDKPVNLYDPATWLRYGWGLADPGQAKILAMLMPEIEDEARRRRIAMRYLNACLERARQFHRALDRPASPPAGTRLHLFAGDGTPTAARLTVDPDTGQLHSANERPGDGRVPRYSALMDERVGGRWQPRLKSPIDWHSVHLLFEDHLGLTRNPVFTDNVLHLLLEAQRVSKSK